MFLLKRIIHLLILLNDKFNSEHRVPSVSRGAPSQPAASVASGRSTATATGAATAIPSSAHPTDADADAPLVEQPPSEEQIDRLGERTLQELRAEREMRLRLASLELELSDMHVPRIVRSTDVFDI